MNETDRSHDEKVIEDVLHVSPETARVAAEDLDARGPRKPASDAVEQERIERAREQTILED
jgi:hypothetical protein